MKKISHNRVNFILLISLTIWTTIFLIVQSIPSLSSAIHFVENVKYEIIGGYVDEWFFQKEIINYLSYCIFHTITFSFITIFSVITIFKPKTINIVGITLIIQNFTLLSLSIWNKFLVDIYNNTIVIDIKLYLGLIVLAAIVIVLISLKQKIFYFILGIITLLQCLNTISLIVKYIGSINNIQVIFQCFSDMLTLILYWGVLLSINRSNNPVKSC